MQEMLYPTSYIKSRHLGKECALITDGRFSGGTSVFLSGISLLRPLRWRYRTGERRGYHRDQYPGTFHQRAAERRGVGRAP